MRRGALIFVGLSLLAIVMAGCWNPFSSDDGGGGKPPIVYDRKTRDNLLNFFANAYERKDLQRYDESLHTRFQFEFTEDVADSLGLPEDEPWWGKTEDLASTENMFDRPTVARIQMNLGTDPAWFWCQVIRRNPEPAPPDTLEGFCTRVKPDIQVTIQEAGKEDLILWVNESFLDIAVTPDPHDEDLWQIVEIAESKIP